jgi:hypothetical protein
MYLFKFAEQVSVILSICKNFQFRYFWLWCHAGDRLCLHEVNIFQITSNWSIWYCDICFYGQMERTFSGAWSYYQRY